MHNWQYLKHPVRCYFYQALFVIQNKPEQKEDNSKNLPML